MRREVNQQKLTTEIVKSAHKEVNAGYFKQTPHSQEIEESTSMRRMYMADTKNTKSKFLEVKIQMYEMKSTLEFTNSRLDNAREKGNKLKNTEIV